MLGRVDVGAVVERVRVERGLYAEVPVRPAPRTDRTAAQHRKRLLEILPSVIDEVAALDHEIRTERPDRGEHPGEHVQREASCGRKVDWNGDPRRFRKVTRAGEDASSTCASVTCAIVASTFAGVDLGASSSRSISAWPGPTRS